MALEIRQVQKLAQQLVMTPQLQQAIKLLQLSRVELQEMVSKELQDNPALEEGTAEATGDDGDSPPSWENSLTKKTSLEDYLIWQLRLSKISEREETIGLYIIGNLDENGYLALSTEELCRATEK